MGAKFSSSLLIPTAGSTTQLEPVGYAASSGFQDVIARSMGLGAPAPASAGQLQLTAGTITVSKPAITVTQTWNAGGVTFKGVTLAFTNTASAAASRTFEITVGGSSVFNVSATGQPSAPYPAGGVNGEIWGSGTSNGSGSNVTILGNGSTNTTGAGVCIVGALSSNTSGGNTTIVGAASTNTTGNANTIVGAGSLIGAASSVTLVGQGTSSGTGASNIVIGQGSSVTGTSSRITIAGTGTTVATGTSQQVVIGDSCTGGGNQTVIVGSGTSSVGQSFNIMIGAGLATGSQSNTLIVGQAAQSAANAPNANNQAVWGTDGAPYSSWYIGRGRASGTTGTITLSATDGSGVAISGSGLTVSAGISGDAATASGNVNVAVALAGSGTTRTNVLSVSPTAGGTVTVTGVVSVVGGTVTASTPPINATQTWNSAGVTFRGIDYAVTNTASAAASTFLRFQGGAGGATEKFSVGIDGQTTITSTSDTAFTAITSNVTTGRCAAFASAMSLAYTGLVGIKSMGRFVDSAAIATGVGGGVTFDGDVNAANYQPLVSIYASKVNATVNDRNAWFVIAPNNATGVAANNGVATFAVKDLFEQVNSGVVRGWTASATDPTAAADNGISRLGAASLAFGNGASGDFTGSIKFTTAVQIGKTTTYNNVATAGWGHPAIYAAARSVAQTAAVASVAAFTVGSADGTFLVSANVLVTTSTTHNFTCTVAYTDESNTARTLTLTFSQLAGTFVTAITNVTGAGPYEGVPMHIRCKASTGITIATTGTFTTVTYNVDGLIQQVS